MIVRNASILAIAIACCALAAPMQDAADNAPRGEPRQQDGGRERRGGRGGMPLPPDWPRAGGYGSGGQGAERPMIEGLVVEGLIPATFGRRELNDDDLARVLAVAREVAPEWGDAIEARIKQDPVQVKASLRTSGRRLLGLVALKERAPKVYAVKVEELRAQAETDHAAEELRAAESSGTAKPEAVNALRAALAAAAAKQADATLAARQAELDALEERLKKLRADVSADVARRTELAEQVASDSAKRAQKRSEQPQAPKPRRE